MCVCVCLLQEMREKMKTDTSLLVVGGADEQVSQVSIRDIFWLLFSGFQQNCVPWERGCFEQLCGCHALLDNSNT